MGYAPLMATMTTTMLILGFAGCVDSGSPGGASFTKQSYNENLVNGIINVPANNHHYYSFTMGPSADSVRVVGHFTASGGSGNDIRVLLMDQQAYTNWKNGHQVNVYYNSGQLTTDTFDVTLPNGSGTYYLVYDNQFSTFTSKQVNTRADMTYRA